MLIKTLPFRLYTVILLVIFALIPFHAPISVYFGSTFPDYQLLIKSWKEILLGASLLLGVVVAAKNKEVLVRLKDKLFILVALYALLHLLLIPFFDLTPGQVLAGLLIDLRYLLFFVLVYMAVVIKPDLRQQYLVVSAIAGVIVIAFSLLQIFVLPIDVLKHIGYGPETILPYMTVDQNHDYIRINGTLRGPNPLGAYALTIAAIAAAFVLHKKNQELADKKVFVGVGLLLLVSPLVVWASYSRSALAAAIISLLVVGVVLLGKKLSIKKWVVFLGIPALAVGALLFIYKDSAFVQNVIVHNNPEDTVAANSNEGHYESLREGADRAISQPLGAGPGSTGSASLFSDAPIIIENQYLFIAHEVGWFGFILFSTITAIVMLRLWKKRSDWLSVGLFASGVGLLLIGILLPVWADDTVSLVWWGLAAAVLASGKAKPEEA